MRKGDQPGASVENVPQLSEGEARDQAGKAVGVSGKLIDQAAEAVGPPGRECSPGAWGEKGEWCPWAPFVRVLPGRVGFLSAGSTGVARGDILRILPKKKADVTCCYVGPYLSRGGRI